MTIETLAITIRLCSFASISLIAGVPLFLAIALGRQGAGSCAGSRFAYAALAAATAALSVAGLLASAAMMGGGPLFPVDWQLVSIIMADTAVGKAMVVRLALSILLVAVTLSAGLNRNALLIPLSTIAAASLAWGGHAAANEGGIGLLHLGSDIIHILAASLWIGGMACLLLSLRRDRLDQAGPMLRVFAPVGTVIVALLLATGIINAILTIGLDNLPAVAGTTYGRLLAAKIAIFLIMLGLAANNRFRLVPRFETGPAATYASLRKAILVEISCAMLILWLVAWFGTLDPTGL